MSGIVIHSSDKRLLIPMRTKPFSDTLVMIPRVTQYHVVIGVRGGDMIAMFENC